MIIPAELVTLAVADSAMDALRWVVGLPIAAFHGYGWLLRTIFDLVRSLFEAYGYWVIFLGTLLENTLLLGLFVPGALIVVLAGLSAHDGALSLPTAFAFGVLGTVLGDTASYLMGRFGWRRLERFSPVHRFTSRVRDPILRRGALFVLFYHFAGYSRLVGPAAAGLLRMPYRYWALADHLGAVLWVTSFLGVGYGVGAAGISLASTDRWLRYVEWGLLVIASAWLLYAYQSSRMSLSSLLAKLKATDEPGEQSEVEAVDEVEAASPQRD